MHRARILEKCGGPAYTSGSKHYNPYDKRDAMIIENVDYSTYGEYEESTTPVFLFFLYLILLVWYVSLLSEFKQILALIDFSINFKLNNHSPMLTPKMENWVRENMTGKWARLAKRILPIHDPHADDDVSACA